MTQKTLLEEPERAPKKPEPIQLRAPHDNSLVVQALELRKEDLKKLSTKTSAEGYAREARVMDADANAIEHHILPLFREQRELPLVSPEDLEKSVAAAIRPTVYRAFDSLGDPKVVVTYDGISHRRETLHTQLAKRIALYVRDVAEEAWRQGYAARDQTAESVALRSIETLAAREV